MKKFELTIYRYNIYADVHYDTKEIILTNDIYHEIGVIVTHTQDYINGISFKEL